jgi:hypothetical protein
MRNKNFLILLLWLSKIMRLLILLASVVIIAVIIYTKVNPEFKPDFSMGYFAFKPIPEVPMQNSQPGNAPNFVVNSMLVNNSTFNEGSTVFWIFILNIFLNIAITVYILNQAISLLKNLLHNNIFHREHALKLRRIAYTMLAGWALTLLLSLILTILLRGSISLPGYQFQYFYAGGKWFTSSIAPGLIILVIAEIFSIGTELKEESDLTV